MKALSDVENTGGTGEAVFAHKKLVTRIVPPTRHVIRRNDPMFVVRDGRQPDERSLASHEFSSRKGGVYVAL
jgi:hypothetical protein